MRTLILYFIMAAIVASIATGCSSQKDASDTTAKDTTKVEAVPASGDTTYMDTKKKDTTHH